jgi:hypothetical protein
VVIYSYLYLAFVGRRRRSLGEGGFVLQETLLIPAIAIVIN